MELPMTDESDLEALASPLARAEDLEPDQHPHLDNISAGLLFWRFLLVPVQPPPPPEYVHIPVLGKPGDPATAERMIMVTRWNAAWEAGPMRFGMFEKADIPADLRWLSTHADSNIRLVPDSWTRPYAAYAPLYHLLPIATLKKFDLVSGLRKSRDSEQADVTA